MGVLPSPRAVLCLQDDELEDALLEEFKALRRKLFAWQSELCCHSAAPPLPLHLAAWLSSRGVCTPSAPAEWIAAKYMSSITVKVVLPLRSAAAVPDRLVLLPTVSSACCLLAHVFVLQIGRMCTPWSTCLLFWRL